MPQVSKKTVTKTSTTRATKDSWLDGETAKSTKTTRAKPAAKKVARKVAAKKAPAKKTVARKTRKPRQPKAAVTVKAIRTKMGRTELLDHLVSTTEVDKASVKAVLEALKTTMLGHIAPRGAGEFVMPGMFKIATRKIPAKKVAAIKKGTEVRNPRTGQTYEHAGRKAFVKPATVKVRIRPMKAMKDVAIGVQ